MLSALADDLGLSGAVTFEGRRPFSDVEAALSQAWALLAPSLWPEPLGLTAIEAITRGVPAIASAHGGFAESIQMGVSGTLVPNGDQRALVGSLVDAVDRGPQAVPEEAVRELRQRHAPAQHTAHLTAVFEQVIRASGRRGS
jgi:glycosyltransferase involved in cell wall biosynthesis